MREGAKGSCGCGEGGAKRVHMWVWWGRGKEGPYVGVVRGGAKSCFVLFSIHNEGRIREE